ncbi:DNA double-strand break repair protein Rad50 [Candidatus Phytoplasma meliae]|uniref:DNA double-strand break repair protein Rad50 n=1 Tax=Candidatus Phytoplasma meliae TaxID=1848402 RepID=A0ABS5CZ30_9MOLU|nr:DNA double-strand break repair protein Rad50 [Candidatus Phytoplasma meliae]MBP5836229.1 DNA double-strand break repair protein Rad50 [Candidatus Phytoplasma meliae]
MLSPLDLIKTYLNFKSYLTWFLMASFIFGMFLFFKRKLSNNQPTQHTTTRKGYLIYFLIIIGLLGFIYLCFFHKPQEPSSKYVGQLVNEIDKAIDKYDEVINNYQGLKDNWEQELTKVEAELKKLYEEQKLTQEQKEKIKELIKQTETKINDLKKQKKQTENNINILKEQKSQKEEALANKEKEIKLTEKQIAEATDLTEKQKLRAKLDILYDEKIALVKEITEIESQIGTLENKIKALNSMLSNAIKLKDSLQRDYDKLTLGEQTLFNQIQSIEQRRNEIQNNINQVNKKLEEIKAEREIYQALKEKYKAMHVRMETYEKEHEASAGNIVKWGFKAFDKITDLIPAKYGIKTLDKATTVTRKYAQGMGKVTLTLHEGHRLWHMINESIQEGKEHPPMITKETLEMYTKDIDRDLAKLDADYKDQEKKIEEYNKRIEIHKLREEEQTDKNQLKEFKQQDESHIAEYVNIVQRLTNKRDILNNKTQKDEKIEQLEIKLEPIDEEIKLLKEELKQTNPNYNKTQERIKQTNKTKIPELIPIPS